MLNKNHNILGFQILTLFLVLLGCTYSKSESIKFIKDTLDHPLKDTSLIKSTTVETSNLKIVGQIKSKVWLKIVLSEQQLYLYENGNCTDTFKVSTGKKNYRTPVMDRMPNGPTYMKYSSRKYPGGNYKGLGNMPYAIFIRGGYAIHGATPGSFRNLGKPVSHGCIRLHPEHAKHIYELVNHYSLKETWVTIIE